MGIDQQQTQMAAQSPATATNSIVMLFIAEQMDLHYAAEHSSPSNTSQQASTRHQPQSHLQMTS